ncbi:MAG: M48 family peptidase, partial [Acidobacteriaceae bacterium]
MALLLTSGAIPSGAQQSATTQPASTQSQPAQNTSALSKPVRQAPYNLPPAILAKAITLTRLRTLLDFGGTAWMILVLLIVLALRWPAALRNWAERITSSKWRQGLLFLPLAIVFITLIPLPLAIFGQHIERAYGLSVQSWPSWTLDQLKGLGLSILVYTPILM